MNLQQVKQLTQALAFATVTGVTDVYSLRQVEELDIPVVQRLAAQWFNGDHDAVWVAASRGEITDQAFTACTYAAVRDMAEAEEDQHG